MSRVFPIGLGVLSLRRFGSGLFWILALLIPIAVVAYIATDMRVKVITGQSLEYYLRRAIHQNALRWGGDGHRYLMPLLLPLIGGGAVLGGATLVLRQNLVLG